MQQNPVYPYGEGRVSGNEHMCSNTAHSGGHLEPEKEFSKNTPPGFSYVKTI
jgi:hypothetical protein